MVIRTCLFDLGNVLVHFSHDRMCQQMGALCDRSATEIRRLLIESGLQDEFERGRVSESEFHQRFEQQVGETVDFDALRQAGADIFWLNEPMPSILDALKAAGVRLVLLSNTSVTHFEFVRQTFDVLDRFDEFVLSYRVGALKPDPVIFEAAIKTAGCDPEECFYTDDVAEYVEHARTLGLQAEQFTDAETLSLHLQSRGISV